MKTLPVILLLGLIIMFEFIPSVIATTKIFSQSNIPFRFTDFYSNFIGNLYICVMEEL